jgi:IgGFc binding protein
MTRAAFAAVLALAAALALAACGRSSPYGDVCAPGYVRCGPGAALQQCADDGASWVTEKDCGASGLTCDAHLGCVACTPDSRSCDGQAVVRCRSDGSALDTLATCDATANQVCYAGDCIDACQLAAEQHSYQGCEYWGVDLDNAVVADQGAATAQQYAIALSNPSALDATVTVDIWCTAEDAANPALGCTAGQPFTIAGPFDVAPGDLRVIDLDPREVDGATSPELNDGPGTFRSFHAYHVTSTAPLIAYQFNPLDNVGVFSNDASLLLPTESLADRYLVLSWPQTLAVTSDGATNGGIDLRAFLTIVATADQTTVDVTLSTDVIGGAGVGPARAGDTIHVVLDRYEVLNLETGGFNADFTSTEIRTAGKPVAVFTGSEASDVPRFDTLADRQCCADHLEEQLFPEDAFGQSFVAVKTPLRSKYVAAAGWPVAVAQDEPEDWRIVADQDGTVVHTSLPVPDDLLTLDRGQAATFESTGDFTVQASRPISLGQFPVGQQATGIPSTLPDGSRPPGGDPSSIMVPPVEQWRQDYLILVPDKYAFDFLLLAAPSTARIRYDGLDLEDALDCEYHPAGNLPIGPDGLDLQYVAIRCPLSKPSTTGPGVQDDGVHYLTTTTGDHFGLVVWGWDSYVSYGYPGGTNVSPINPL